VGESVSGGSAAGSLETLENLIYIFMYLDPHVSGYAGLRVRVLNFEIR